MNMSEPSTATLLAIMTTVIVAFLAYYLVVYSNNEHLITFMLGNILGSWGTIIAFYFGASKNGDSNGSSDKK